MNWEGKTILPEDSTEWEYWSLPASVGMGLQISFLGKENLCPCRRCKRHRFDPWVRKISWKKARQLTPVFLLGKCHGPRNLADYSPKDHKELVMTEATWHAHTHSENKLMSWRKYKPRKKMRQGLLFLQKA